MQRCSWIQFLHLRPKEHNGKGWSQMISDKFGQNTQILYCLFIKSFSRLGVGQDGIIGVLIVHHFVVMNNHTGGK